MVLRCLMIVTLLAAMRSHQVLAKMLADQEKEKVIATKEVKKRKQYELCLDECDQ